VRDDQLHENLNALIDGALDDDRASELREQIERDPAIRAEFDRLRRVRELVRALPRARASIADSVRAALPAAASAPSGEDEHSVAPSRAGLRPWQWGGGIAAIAAVLLAAVLLWPPGATRLSSGHTELSRLPQPEESTKQEAVTRAERESEPRPRIAIGAHDTDVQDPGVQGTGVHAEKSFDRGLADDRAVEESEVVESAESDADSEPEAKPDALGKTKLKKQTARPRSVLSRVERGGTVLSRAERSRYFAEIARLNRRVLRAHLGKVAERVRAIEQRAGVKNAKLPAEQSDSSADSSAESPNAAHAPKSRQKRSGTAQTRQVVLIALDRDEANEIVRVISRVVSMTAAKKQGGARMFVKAEARKESESHLRFESSARELAILETWLRRVGLRSGRGGATVRLAGSAGLAGGGSGTKSESTREAPVEPGSSDAAGDRPQNNDAGDATDDSKQRTNVWIRVRYGTPRSANLGDD